MSRKRKHNNTTPNKQHARVRAQLLAFQHYIDLFTGEDIPDFRSGSYHHLVKNEHGGDYSVTNGAMLLMITHNYLHNFIEINDKELYDLVTECLFLYKECIDQRHTKLMEQFQQEIQPKAKQLVKEYKSTRK